LFNREGQEEGDEKAEGEESGKEVKRRLSLGRAAMQCKLTLL